MTDKILDEFSKRTVLVIGDVMLDRYIYGTIDRVSPESPVPVLQYSNETVMPGGAANAASNIASLGARTILIGIAGNDLSGNQLDEILTDLNISPFIVIDEQKQTTEKTRIIGQQNHQIARVDREESSPVQGRTRELLEELILEWIKDADSVLIADYAKGVITPEITGYIMEQAKKHDIPVIVDPKGRDYAKYRGAAIIKPNVKEFEEITGRHITSDEEAREGLIHLVDEFDLKGAVLTRGGVGMSIINERKDIMHIPAEAQEVYDVSGAGDTVAAVLSLALACGMSLFGAARVANTAAAVVVSHAGTVPVLKGELEQALLRSAIKEEGKIILELSDLKAKVEAVRSEGKKVVFTNGCFDLLHYGHVRYLQHAKIQGDFLVVAINADETVKRLKGEGRPVIPQDQRAHLLASLQCVDAVTVFYEDKPLRYLEELKPDILVKGSDYTREGVVGHEIVDGYGGDIYLAPLEDGWSTTHIIERINKAHGED